MDFAHQLIYQIGNVMKGFGEGLNFIAEHAFNEWITATIILIGIFTITLLVFCVCELFDHLRL